MELQAWCWQKRARRRHRHDDYALRKPIRAPDKRAKRSEGLCSGGTCCVCVDVALESVCLGLFVCP